MVTNQENQYELAIENFSFMTFLTCALSIFCNQTKADTCNACWSVQTSVSNGKGEIMWNVSLHVQYISSVHRNTSGWFQRAFELQFALEALEGQVLCCPISAATGSWDNLLVPFYHKSVSALSEWSSPFPCPFSKFHPFYPVTEDQLVSW